MSKIEHKLFLFNIYMTKNTVCFSFSLDNMQYIFIASGTGVILLIILIATAVGVKKWWVIKQIIVISLKVMPKNSNKNTQTYFC